MVKNNILNNDLTTNSFGLSAVITINFIFHFILFCGGHSRLPGMHMAALICQDNEYAYNPRLQDCPSDP